MTRPLAFAALYVLIPVGFWLALILLARAIFTAVSA